MRIPTTLDDCDADEFISYADEPCERVLMGDEVVAYLPDGDRCNTQLVRVVGVIDMAMYDNQGNLAGLLIVDSLNDSYTVPGTQEIFRAEVQSK